MIRYETTSEYFVFFIFHPSSAIQSTLILLQPLRYVTSACAFFVCCLPLIPGLYVLLIAYRTVTDLHIFNITNRHITPLPVHYFSVSLSQLITRSASTSFVIRSSPSIGPSSCRIQTHIYLTYAKWSLIFLRFFFLPQPLLNCGYTHLFLIIILRIVSQEIWSVL